MQSAHLNPDVADRSLRTMAWIQLIASASVPIVALLSLGFAAFAGNGLPVLAAQEMPHAALWRVMAYALPGVLAAIVAACLWWRSPQAVVRISAFMMLISALAHLAQAFLPINLTFLLDPVNEWAGLCFTVWWIAGTMAAVLMAWANEGPGAKALAMVAALVALAGVFEWLPQGMHALVMWAQMLIFAVNLEKSTRLT